MRKPNLQFFVPLLALFSNGANAQTNLIVAADGTGQFETVQAALMAISASSAANPVFIHIKPGIHKELLSIQRDKRFFHLIREDPTRTVLSYNLLGSMPCPDGKLLRRFGSSASTIIDADDFTAENVTFENSAGAGRRSSSDSHRR